MFTESCFLAVYRRHASDDWNIKSLQSGVFKKKSKNQPAAENLRIWVIFKHLFFKKAAGVFNCLQSQKNILKVSACYRQRHWKWLAFVLLYAA